jgi:hypothetical protein
MYSKILKYNDATSNIIMISSIDFCLQILSILIDAKNDPAIKKTPRSIKESALRIKLYSLKLFIKKRLLIRKNNNNKKSSNFIIILFFFNIIKNESSAYIVNSYGIVHRLPFIIDLYGLFSKTPLIVYCVLNKVKLFGMYVKYNLFLKIGISF